MVMSGHLISKLIAVSINGKKYLLKQNNNICINAAIKSKDERSRYLKI